MGRPLKSAEQIEKELSVEFRNFMEPILELKGRNLSGQELYDSACSFAAELWNALITDYYLEYSTPESYTQKFINEYKEQPEYLEVIKKMKSRKKTYKQQSSSNGFSKVR